MILLFERAWDILVKNRYPYFVFNLLYYGIILLVMAYTGFNAPLQEQVLSNYKPTYMTGALVFTDPAITTSQIVRGLGFTFLVNLLGFTYGNITLPSFFIPFAGVLLGLYRAVMLGIVFSPFNTTIREIILPHLPTLFIEGQACVLAMLGAYIQGRAIFWPKSIGQVGHWKAYVEGVRQTGTLYLFIMAILLISAIYGGIEVILLIG
jgi:hypothetical protein